MSILVPDVLRIAEFICDLVVKINSLDVKEAYRTNKIAEQGIIIIDFLNEKSKTFSMKRMNLKKALRPCV